MAFASEPVDFRFSHLALLNDNGSLFYATKILNSERDTDKLVQRYVGICSALNDTTMSLPKDYKSWTFVRKKVMDDEKLEVSDFSNDW